MRVLKFLFALALTVLVHVLLARLWPESVEVLDLFLILTVLVAVGGRSAPAIAAGVAAGFARDTFSGGLYGLHGFADTLIGYLVARVAQRIDLDNLPAVGLATAVATLAQKVVLIVLGLAFSGLGETPEPLWVLVQAGLNGLLAGLLYSLGGRLRRLRSAAERRRLSRLRL